VLRIWVLLKKNILTHICIIYFDDGAFYVKFPCDTPTFERIVTMSFVREAVYGRADWLEERLSDASSSVAASDISMETVSAPSVSDMSELNEFWSDESPTPSEAFSN
jgi:hypothetical protein